MNLNKNDFIEINFTAKIKDTGEVFDSNLKQELQKINLNIEAKPFIFSLGNNMFIKGIDDFLIGKSFESFPAEFNIEISPENAFGLRNSQLIYTCQ
jgi:FKBP-type peptidyl-prolyl cis-trans isomerase 2